jgi:hypothetical protein
MGRRIELESLPMIYLHTRKEGILPKHPGVYRAEKRRKELSRQKKQEERRQRRLYKGDATSSEAPEGKPGEVKPGSP